MPRPPPEPGKDEVKDMGPPEWGRGASSAAAVSLPAGAVSWTARATTIVSLPHNEPIPQVPDSPVRSPRDERCEPACHDPGAHGGRDGPVRRGGGVPHAPARGAAQRAARGERAA